jgi:hypothetical protein
MYSADITATVVPVSSGRARLERRRLSAEV